MQPQPRQRIFAQTRGEKSIPDQARLPAPRAARTVNQRLRAGPLARAQVENTAEPRGVGKAEIPRRLLGVLAEKPRRRDKPGHLETRAGQHLADAAAQLRVRQGELAAEDLRLAQDALGEITGRVSSDALLGRIFSSFCIGK